ncbi:periplasmic heavy metal sensor [Caulobacter segnis]|uniref:periplasmic heavy metal sensor n=1 Tax=Caulobacter segnis TaxID=88688 RepID=UPI002857361D|nr:periplasmic heavy metal sensor [Caulobacter segnis]MDR6623755.1 putative membrane protein [Caulobacter segnis]
MNGSRVWIIALAASAAINVFLIGGVAGMAFVRLTTPATAAPPAAPVVVPAAPSARPAPPPAVETPKPTPRLSPRPAASTPAASAPPVQAPPEAASAPVVVGAPRPPLISAGEVLSPESRRAFRKALNEANRRNRPIIQQARAERQAALSALGAPGYDPAEVSRRLATARDLDQQARANVEAALTAFTATLSPPERAALADGLAKVYTPLGARRAAMAGAN